MIVLGIDEQWLPVIRTGGKVMVSNHGRIRSVSGGKILKPYQDKDGYLVASVYVGGGRSQARQQKVRVHRAVLEAFVGPCPKGMEAAHLDGCVTNNHVSNLAWMTHKENCAHKKAHGTELLGEHHPRAKLTVEQVVRIRRSVPHERQTLADEFGIHYSTLYDVLRGETWKEVAS